ncbi:hypothetical protein ACROYT_G027953 [Oculina patagonica]
MADSFGRARESPVSGCTQEEPWYRYDQRITLQIYYTCTYQKMNTKSQSRFRENQACLRTKENANGCYESTDYGMIGFDVVQDGGMPSQLEDPKIWHHTLAGCQELCVNEPCPNWCVQNCPEICSKK